MSWIGSLRVFLIFLTMVFAVSCETKDGNFVDPLSLGYQSCQIDNDCGTGRFCDESTKTCSIECTTSKDCNYKYNSNSYSCSPCGRCIPEGKIDNNCILTKDIKCSSRLDCENYYKSKKYECVDGACWAECAVDSDCRRMGNGFFCNTQKGVCYRKCFRDNDCYFHGWQYYCDLPAGVDKEKNENAPVGEEIFGECKARVGGIDWGKERDKGMAAADYEGVWGFLLSAAMTIKNVPFVNTQNVVLKSLLIVKITQRYNIIDIHKRWCNLEFINFDDENPEKEELAKIVLPERYAFYMPSAKISVQDPPPLKTGDSFSTDRIRILFGARLQNIDSDKLPNKADPVRQFDDDRDGLPGVTVYVNGVINGEMYTVQRFWTTLDVVVTDKDHLSGLIDFGNELSIIDANPAILYYEPAIEKYKNPNRSYFKAIRIPVDSSCNDLINISRTDNWLKYEDFYNTEGK